MLIVTANCKNTFDSYLKYVHYTDSKRRKTRFSGATGWLLLACAAAVTVSFVKIGGNIFLYVVSAVLVLCAAAYVYIQYLAPYRAFKKLDKSFLAEQEFDFYEDKLELIEHGEKRIKRRHTVFKDTEGLRDEARFLYLYRRRQRVYSDENRTQLIVCRTPEESV